MNPLNLPKLTKYINDFSDIFTVEQIEAMSKIFIDHENTTTEQVVTVFIPHREGNELLDIGMKIFDENGIGQKNLNNGLLLIIATEEKKIRIITGKGMEIKYTEMVCRNIIEKHLRPLLNEGKYEDLMEQWIKISSLGYISPNKVTNTEAIQLASHFIGGVIFFFGFLIINSLDGFSKVINNILTINVMSGFFIFLIFILFIVLILYLSGQNRFIKGIYRTIFVLMLLTLGILIVFQPKCVNQLSPDFSKTECSRVLFGKQFETVTVDYTTSYKQAHPEEFRSSYSSNSSSSDWSSSDSSSSSDFGGGGGSSNGGGYGD